MPLAFDWEPVGSVPVKRHGGCWGAYWRVCGSAWREKAGGRTLVPRSHFSDAGTTWSRSIVDSISFPAGVGVILGAWTLIFDSHIKIISSQAGILITIMVSPSMSN